MKEPKKIDNFEDWDVPELATAISTLMLDLRGSWGEGTDTYRMSETIRMLTALKTIYETMSAKDKFVLALNGEQKEIFKGIDHDLKLIRRELNEHFDGRVVRSCNLYSYTIIDGRTDRVKMYLHTVMSYPEYSWVVNDDEYRNYH